MSVLNVTNAINSESIKQPKPLDIAEIISNIRNTIVFKKALLKLTQDEINGMEQEINYLKEKADLTGEKNPPDYE